MTEHAVPSAPQPAESDAPALPLDERIYWALVEAGFDEDEAQSACDVALPMFAEALRDAASEVEWRFRSLTFRCGTGEHSTLLHPAGALLRGHADALDPRPIPPVADQGGSDA